MRYRQLGTSGLTVSVVGLGCNNFGNRCDLERTRAVVEAALAEGITLLDTSDSYGGGDSERFLGEVLKGRRDQVVLATKFGTHVGGLEEEARGSRRYIRHAVEQSLRRLQTDYIDLYQHHRPDPKTPLEETVAALDELVTEGKVRYGGSSNYAGFRIADADWIASVQHRARLVSAQNHYSLLERGVEQEVIPACVEHRVGMLPFFPLASGLLTGKYKRDGTAPQGSRLVGRADWLTAEAFDKVEALGKYASERDLSLLDVAVGGLAAQPAVASVIAGATRPEQVHANVKAADWHPTPDDLADLDAIAPRGSSTRR
ncbi:MAG TPA: aldo/keto reductase [Actinomycetota bacterium]|nr:aldo/keto reductase [Actinomycetota bacterium]